MVCLTDALTSPQLSTEVGRIGQAHGYREPEYDGRDHVCVLPVMYAVYIYQTLPRGGTIPNAPWIRVRRRLPNITGSFARDANLLGVFGMVYQRLPVSILAGILPQDAFTKHHRLVTRTGIIRYENYMCGELM